MKRAIAKSLTFIILSMAICSVEAHDPSLHTDNVGTPNCEALSKMDHTKMKANDPVMMALMKKCHGEQEDTPTASSHKMGAGKHSQASGKAEDKHGDDSHH